MSTVSFLYLTTRFHNDYPTQTIFLRNPIIDKGIFNWTIQIHYNHTSDIGVGIAPADDLSKYDNESLGRYPGSCCFNNSQEDYPSYNILSRRVSLLGAESPFGSGNVQLSVAVPDNSVVSIEADTVKQTLCYFVKGWKMSYGISKVFPPFNFGVCAFCCPFFTALSLRRLPFSTPSPVVCRFCPCKT